jgi:hypothetical protein
LKERATRKDLEKEIESTLIDKATLMGYFKK